MLLEGLDEIGLTLHHAAAITAYERAHPELAPALKCLDALEAMAPATPPLGIDPLSETIEAGPDGSPIARLYSAGELGSIYSYLYQGTGNIGECLAFGRISGRNAAAEAPWA